MIRLPGAYLFFLSGLFISRIGDALYTLAIPWISYELTQSAFVMSSVYAVSVLPIVLFGPVIGVLVDYLGVDQLEFRPAGRWRLDQHATGGSVGEVFSPGSIDSSSAVCIGWNTLVQSLRQETVPQAMRGTGCCSEGG